MRKMSLIPVLNINSPQVHMESELDMLGIHGKLVKFRPKEKIEKRILFFTQATQTAINQFWSQGILGIKCML
jgi:hypothetical protein